MNQVNSRIYQKLSNLIDLSQASDTHFVHQTQSIAFKNIGADNGFFFLLEITTTSYKAIVRVWQNHQAEVMAFFDPDWKPVYETRNGVEFPNHPLRNQANHQLLSLLSN